MPTDNEWKTLEKSMGMTDTEADGTDWHGSDQGTQLKAVVHDGTNTVGFNALLTGYHQYNTNGTPANSETWS